MYMDLSLIVIKISNIHIINTKAICESNLITISTVRKGTTIDDSPIENWYTLLKKKLFTTIISYLYKNIYNL